MKNYAEISLLWFLWHLETRFWNICLFVRILRSGWLSDHSHYIAHCGCGSIFGGFWHFFFYRGWNKNYTETARASSLYPSALQNPLCSAGRGQQTVLSFFKRLFGATITQCSAAWMPASSVVVWLNPYKGPLFFSKLIWAPSMTQPKVGTRVCSQK